MCMERSERRATNRRKTTVTTSIMDSYGNMVVEKQGLIRIYGLSTLDNYNYITRPYINDESDFRIALTEVKYATQIT